MTDPGVVHVEVEVPEGLYQKVIEKVEAQGGMSAVFERFLEAAFADSVPLASRNPAICGHPRTFPTPSGKVLCATCKKPVKPVK